VKVESAENLEGRARRINHPNHPPLDAFARMYSWRNDIPDWCDREEPVCAALQAAVWIGTLYNQYASPDMDKARAKLDWANLLVSELGDRSRTWFKYSLPPPEADFSYAEVRYRYCELPDRAFKLLAHYRKHLSGEPPRLILLEDIGAARDVINYWSWILRCIDFNRPRRRNWISARDITRCVVVEHLTLQETASKLGLQHHSSVNARLKEVIDIVAASVGDFRRDLPVPHLHRRNCA
jgi:hypothetical protein